MMIHQLKSKQEFFEATLAGKKAFELRLNDRDFQEGDFLALNELLEIVDVDAPGFVRTELSGRCCLVEVTHVLKQHDGLPPNWCCMSVRKAGIYKEDNYDRRRISELYAVPVYGRNEKER
jgi:hypothetical protein